MRLNVLQEHDALVSLYPVVVTLLGLAKADREVPVALV